MQDVHENPPSMAAFACDKCLERLFLHHCLKSGAIAEHARRQRACGSFQSRILRPRCMDPIRSSSRCGFLLIGVLLLAARLASAEDSDAIAGKILAGTCDVARIQTLTQRLAVVDQATVWCVWYECAGDWSAIATTVCPGLQKQRATIAKRPYLVTTCAEGMARAGDVTAARTFLAQGDWSGTGAQPAMGWAAAGRIAVVEHAWKDAAEHLKRAQAALATTASDASPPWLIALAKRRVDRLRQDLEQGHREEVLGPDYLAWRAAEDRANGAPAEAIAAYDKLVAEYPASRFAGPAALEAARVAWCADMGPECRRRLGLLLAKNDLELHGFTALLAADAEIRFGGDVPAIRRASEVVLAWATSKSDPSPLPAAVRAEIQPTHAPHRFTRWNAPEWTDRERYRVWSWSTAPWARDHLTYQAMTRLGRREPLPWLYGERAHRRKHPRSDRGDRQQPESRRYPHRRVLRA